MKNKTEMSDIYNFHINEHKKVVNELSESLGEDVIRIAKKITSVIKSGGTVFWCGNGGSSSDSQHLSAELIGRFKNNRIPLKSVSLNSDTAAITCIANDFGYDDIFSRQLEGLGSAGDILIPISTSGESNNIVNVINMAKRKKIFTCSLLGKSGGKALKLVDDCIFIKSDTTARVQEMHIMVGHILCDLIEFGLGLRK